MVQPPQGGTTTPNMPGPVPITYQYKVKDRDADTETDWIDYVVTNGSETQAMWQFFGTLLDGNGNEKLTVRNYTRQPKVAR